MTGRRAFLWAAASTLLLLVGNTTSAQGPQTDGSAIPYDAFEPSEACASCHTGIAEQFRQSLMSQCFTHPWDEIEYYQLALPHSQLEPKVAEVRGGCIGCHSPLAFVAGDIPPQSPSAATRANDSIACDFCHSIRGFRGDVPFNFNYLLEPGDAVQGRRKVSENPAHPVRPNPFLGTAEFCGICHNEKDPYGVWVKSTHLEWKEGPYARAGIVCQDCHLPPAGGTSAPGLADERPDIRQHLFHGAHDPGKLAGVIDVRLYPESTEVLAGEELLLTATLLNAKAGHMVPSGSAEERLLWLHVEVRDAAGKVYHLPVLPKGFPGEEWTIADADALAYQDLGEIKQLKDFAGLERDAGVPHGDRIFRLPYLDPQGRMTIAQWHTASLGPDYRLPPLRAVNERFSWRVPEETEPGPAFVSATVWYSKLVPSVGRFLGVPEEEFQPVRINSCEITVTVKRR
ncbi:MAG: multiheme c-type cytochrome [Acidobacteriota bacterium]